jgi:hypothetical protein
MVILNSTIRMGNRVELNAQKRLMGIFLLPLNLKTRIHGYTTRLNVNLGIV